LVKTILMTLIHSAVYAGAGPGGVQTPFLSKLPWLGPPLKKIPLDPPLKIPGSAPDRAAY
jgi:hypothetical protein